MFCFVHLKDILAIFAKAKKVKLCEYNYNVCIVFLLLQLFFEMTRNLFGVFFLKIPLNTTKLKKFIC